MTADETERALSALLHRRADLIDEAAVTGASVRTYAARQRPRSAGVQAALAAAAAVVALIAGIALASVGGGAGHPTRAEQPGSPGAPTSSSTPSVQNGFGSAPKCPSTVLIDPKGSNTVCGIGFPPSVLFGSAVIRTVRP